MSADEEIAFLPDRLNRPPPVFLGLSDVELRMAGLERKSVPDSGAREPAGAESPPATAAEIEGFHAHLETALSTAGFLKTDHSRQLKLRLRRIFQRSRLDRNEVNILRGVLTALDGKREGG